VIQSDILTAFFSKLLKDYVSGIYCYKLDEYECTIILL